MIEACYSVALTAKARAHKKSCARLRTTKKKLDDATTALVSAGIAYRDALQRYKVTVKKLNQRPSALRERRIGVRRG